LAKSLTLTERLAKEWLLSQGYREEQIRFNKQSSPDFLLSDGRKIEVKRPVKGVIYFSQKQWNALSNDVEVFIMHETSKEPLAIVPFSEVRKSFESGKVLSCKGGKFGINVEPEGEILRIRCSRDTLADFIKICGELCRYKGGKVTYEDALRFLMDAFKENPYVFLKPKSGPRIR
jgi:hypothetical protein